MRDAAANLYALEQLHGRAAFNHALFVCAGRLRRVVPQNVEMGRLGEDGFLPFIRREIPIAAASFVIVAAGPVDGRRIAPIVHANLFTTETPFDFAQGRLRHGEKP